MTDLETRLAETLRAQAAQAPGAHDVLDGLDVRRSQPARALRRRNRWLVPALAVAAATAVVLGSLSWLGPDGTSAPVAGSDSATPVVPPGTRLVGMNGVAIAVPESWTYGDVACDGITPAGDTVVLQLTEARDDCLAEWPSDVSALVVMRMSLTSAQSYIEDAAPAGQLDGIDVLRSDNAVVVPAKNLVFAVRSPGSETADEILDSLQILPVGWTTVPVQFAYAPLGEEPPTVPGLEIETEEVWRPGRGPGEMVGVRPLPGSVVPVGSTLTVLMATDQAPIGYTDHDHRITVWHCGIEATTFAGRGWETAWPPPFDATNAPRPYDEPEDGGAFTGHGTMELVADSEAVYTDDGGVVLTFRPAGTPGFGTPDDFICD